MPFEVEPILKSGPTSEAAVAGPMRPVAVAGPMRPVAVAGPMRVAAARAPLGLALLGLALLASATRAHAADDDIRLSSIGFLPAGAKVATVVGGGSSFAVKRDPGSQTVFEGTLSPSRTDPSTGEAVRLADFSAVTTPGTYYVEVPGVGRSVSFPLDAGIYQRQLVSVMLAYYGWRSGVAVSFTHQGQSFGQGPGHLQDGLLDYIGQVGVTRDGSRGWYDAGDYGKYTVNGGFTLGMLLQAWEQYGATLGQLTLQLPERGGSLPDYLDELKWQVEWLTTMPYSASDGRVSHKLSALNFPGLSTLPQDDTAPTYYGPYSSSATAIFVAAAAKSSRAFRPYDAAFADRLISAARSSYAWLRANPDNHAANLAGFNTGTYQSDDTDDRLWAAAEMWEATGDAEALADVEARLSNDNPKVRLVFDWDNVGNLGVFTYALSQRSGRSPQLLASVERAIIERADEAVAKHSASGYGRALDSHYWGTNGQVARVCMILQVAHRIAPNPDYVTTCADQVGHLYGRNLYNRSFVTGEGKDPPMHPHHRPSVGDGVGRPFPGLLVGGPQPSPYDWRDEQDNYWTNEVAINWNGALAYGLASLAACARGDCEGGEIEPCESGQRDETGACLPPPDAGVETRPDAEGPPAPRDAGTPPLDAGAPPLDAGAPPLDVATRPSPPDSATRTTDGPVVDTPPGTDASGSSSDELGAGGAPEDIASDDASDASAGGGCLMASVEPVPGALWWLLVCAMMLRRLPRLNRRFTPRAAGRRLASA
jgi:endoglucanase